MKRSNLIIIFFHSFLLFGLDFVSAGLRFLECNSNCQDKNRKDLFFNLSFKDNQFDGFDSSKKEKNLIKIRDRSINVNSLWNYKFNKTILSILLSQNNDSNDVRNLTEFEIESDIQYSVNDTFFAEGDVEVLFKNAILRADKIQFDKSKSLLKVEGNIHFLKGTQEFKADYFEYNFNENKGLINNIYGFIDFNTFSKNFNFKDFENKDKSCISEQEEDIYNLSSQTSLVGSSNIGLKSKLAFDTFKFDFSKIKKWRFKSKKITLGEDNFSSEIILFTNDPFNEPQFIIKSENFSGEVIDQNIEFKSKSTYLNIDNKLTLPLGGTTIKDSEAKSSWGIGYDAKNKDGLYFKRSSSFLKDSKNHSLNIHQYFLLQRALKGNSNVFREKDSYVFSDKVISKINILDYFALGADLKSNLNGWKINNSLNFKTLNPEKLYDGISTKFNALRTIYNKSKSNKKDDLNECYINFNSEDKFNLNVNLGFYGIFEEGDIHSAYGSKLFTNLSSKNGNLESKYNLVFDIGKYHGKNKDNNDLIQTERFGIASSLQNEYQFLNFNQNLNNFSKDYKYTPELIKQGIFLNTYARAGIYEYIDFGSQSVIALGAGPKIVYGDLKQKFIDYTYISISPKFVKKIGESPFNFDQFNDDSHIELDVEQQIYGPLILGYNGFFKINSDSSDYGELYTKNFKLGIKRRAYSINLTYSPNDKTGFLGFDVFSFDFRNLSPNFK